MVAASEESRRGRPPKYPPELYLRADPEGPRTRRGRQDRFFARVAVGLVRERYPDPDERTRWLFDEQKNTARWTLLSELGRVRAERGERSFWNATEWVLEHRPKVRDAVRRIRAFRTTDESPVEEPLERKLLKVLEPYPDARAVEALKNVLITYYAEERES